MTRIAVEKVLPYKDNTEQKNIQVSRMFNSIAAHYDLLNHLLSLGLDRRWRTQAVKFLRIDNPKTILDIATGTGDLALLMAKTLKPDQIVGIDISEKMLEEGILKAKKQTLDNTISFEKADCMELPYKENSFDAITCAFGVRNFESLKLGLSEMFRVIKPNGKVIILELSKPTNVIIKFFYDLYSRYILPTIGRLFSKNKVAYSYLPKSIKEVPQGDEMCQLLRQAGFQNTHYKTFSFGTCTMYTAEK